MLPPPPAFFLLLALRFLSARDSPRSDRCAVAKLSSTSTSAEAAAAVDSAGAGASAAASSAAPLLLLSGCGYANPVVAQSSIDLPFSAEAAYDAFSDLPRQPTWSPWLKSVRYVDGGGGDGGDEEEAGRVSLWTMRIAGVPYSWRSVSTRQARPHAIEWRSTSGIRNMGRVDFEMAAAAPAAAEDPPDCCRMTLTMAFQAPRVVAALFRGDFSALRRQMEERILGRTLANFRDAVLLRRHDVREDEQARRLRERRIRETGVLFPH
jgi:uncharacterized membrane protein